MSAPLNKDPSKPRERGSRIGGIGDVLSDFAEPLAGGSLDTGVDVRARVGLDDVSAFFEDLRYLYASGGLDTAAAASALPRREGH